MKTSYCLFILVVVSNFLSFAHAEQNLKFSKTYSRGDDDLAYTYQTALVYPSLQLKKNGEGYAASVSFVARLTTEEAQGFAESVRFGMREASRVYRPLEGAPFRRVDATGKPVLFRFMEPGIQQVADSLSNQAMQSGQGVAGNRAEAMDKHLGGTLSLGQLDVGEHQGTIYVQQLAGMQPSQTDTDISVRHLIKWRVVVDCGLVKVEVDRGRFSSSDASVEIAAPSWDGTVRPHRVSLLRDEVTIDGQTYQNALAQYGNSHAEKGSTLFHQDKAELKKEFNPRERREIRREEMKKRVSAKNSN